MDIIEWWFKFFVSTILPVIVLISVFWIMVIYFTPSGIETVIEYKPEYLFEGNPALLNAISKQSDMLESICENYILLPQESYFDHINFKNNQSYCIYKEPSRNYRMIGGPAFVEFEVTLNELISNDMKAREEYRQTFNQLRAGTEITVPILNKMNNAINLTWLCNSTDNSMSMIEYGLVEEWIEEPINSTEQFFTEGCLSYNVSTNNETNNTDVNCVFNVTIKDFNVIRQHRFKVPKWKVKHSVNFCDFIFLEEWNNQNLTFGYDLIAEPIDMYKYLRNVNGTYIDVDYFESDEYKNKIWHPAGIPVIDFNDDLAMWWNFDTMVLNDIRGT